MSSQLPERVFLGWERPLLEGVRSFLLEDLAALPRTLVVVPTSNSGRRLRLALSAEGGGVISPHVVPPSRLFQVDGYATPTQSLWAWVRTIQTVEMDRFPHLFPNHAEGALASFRVALSIAKRLVVLRDQLADADRGFADAISVSPETERWRELCELEKSMQATLKMWGVADPVLGKRRRANAPELPPGVDRIIVAGVADPSLLALKALQKHVANGIETKVLIHAPEEKESAFDAWGLPDEKYWNEAVLSLPEWRSRLHVVEDARQAARQVVSLYANEGTLSDAAALGLCDPSLGPAIEKDMSESGWTVFDPDGKPAADSGLSRLLACCVNLLGGQPAFQPLRELVRIPGAELFLPKSVSRSYASRLMDRLHHEHLPETISDALFLAQDDEEAVIKSVLRHLESISSVNLHDVLRDWLTVWLERADDDLAVQAEPVMAEVLDALGQLIEKKQKVTAREAAEMLLVGMSKVSLSGKQAGSVLDMQGWLELGYDSAPHLVLAGMHEGCVPDGTGDDEFLPDPLKRDLGMRDGRGRSARDAYLLQTMIKSREEQGRVDVVVTRFNDVGEACKPSRLLMRCAEDQLTDVVRHLFHESGSAAHHPGPWTRDWTLTFPNVENPYAGASPKDFSPSAIKDYLNCPLRFFLKRILKMESYETEKHEMDALDFGNLCHAVLEAFGSDPEVCDSADADEIERYLSRELDTQVLKLYGKNGGLPIIVQVESARERLRAFSRVQAKRRAEGWRIKHSEYRVGGSSGVQWALAGHPIRMIIDRIDQNESTGEWAVWDYKTTGKAKSPEDQHLKSWRDAENRPLLGELYPKKNNRARSDRRWSDVQLPLYAEFVREHFSDGSLPGVGYINLPRAVTDVGFESWDKFDDECVRGALSWAEGAMDRILSGQFNEAAVCPASERDWDDFSELAPDGLDAAFGLNRG